MVLSANWLKLRGTDSSTFKKQDANDKKTTEYLVSRKNGVRKTTSKHGQQKDKKYAGKGPNKIMSMVYTMNTAIQNHERQKLEGKEFEFAGPNTNKPADCLSRKLDELYKELGSAISSQKNIEIGKYVAIDCEFVGVGPEGRESHLARITVVNYHGSVVMDQFVRPREKVTDWRTWISGVKPSHMQNAIDFDTAQLKVAKLLSGRILVGHAVNHDLESLALSHPKSLTRDTSKHLPFRKNYAKGKTPSLKKLVKEIFGVDIQVGEHSSVDDARATMLLYRKHKNEFETLHRPT